MTDYQSSKQSVSELEAVQPGAALGRGKSLDDVAEIVLNRHQGDPDITPEEEDRVRRKIDMYLLPLYIMTVAMNGCDKTIYGLSAILGMLADCNLTTTYSFEWTQTSQVAGKVVTSTTRYSLGSAMFYVGYFAGSYPLTYLCQKRPIGRMIALYTIGWGAVVLCFPLANSYQGVYATRFLTGWFESGIFPALTISTGMWYRKQEHPLRAGIWYGAGFLGVIGTYLSCYGIASSKTTYAKWRILYFLNGGITFLWGFVLLFLLPSSPVTCKFLNEREKYVAVERLRVDQVSLTNKHVKLGQIGHALTDVKIWLLCACVYCQCVPNGLSSNFTSVTVKSLGFSSAMTMILLIPLGVVAILGIAFAGIICSNVRGTRNYMIVFMMLPVLIGCCVLWKVPRTNKAAALASCYITILFSASLPQSMALISSNITGFTRKTIVTTLFAFFYACGQITGPLVFLGREAPLYPSGFEANVICAVMAIVLTLLYRSLCVRENARREGLGAIAQEDHAFKDMTDSENMSFRYEL